MDRLIYVAGTSAAHIERAQAVHANNLANVNTNGFRRDFAQARTVAIHGDGYEARHFALAERPGTDFSQGVLDETGRSLDVAIAGSGFLTVALPEGGEAYTRAGNLQVDAFGQLHTATGEPVLGAGGAVLLPPFESVYVGEDGSVSIRPAGQEPQALVQVDRLKLVNPDDAELEKRTDGLFARRDGDIEPLSDEVRVLSGMLESSNVNAVSELTGILSLARQFEIEVRLLRTAEENDESATRLLQVG